MSLRGSLLWLTLCAALPSALACSFDDRANDARGCDERCSICHDGYCLITIEEAANAGGGAGAAAGSSGVGGASGNGGSSGAGGAGGAGGASGVGGAGGNGGAGGGTGGTGAISGAGGSPGCTPAPESCNGADDDCDGALDEEADVACYPDGAVGCVAGADGTFACTGTCAAGVQRCERGALGACEGFVKPSAEICGVPDAADEDCDGNIDDGCPCDAGQTQSCYSGPRRERGVGICREGVQTCEGANWGDCIGEVTAGAESCANPGQDDDCDRLVDDVAGRGGPCFDFTKRGACILGIGRCQAGALVCDTPEPAAAETACDLIDEDCDGDIDEGFAFNRDEDNCGGCGIRCSSGQECCGGACVATNTDQHCGGCNVACTASQDCCGGTCVATNTDQHCGGCNVACAANEDCCGGTCAAVDTTARCGGCDTACGAGQDCCAGDCVELTTPAFCGACNIACTEAQACCEGACVTLGTAAHCGGCGIVCPEPCMCNGVDCVDAMGLACL